MEKDTCCNTGKQKPKCKNTHKQKPKTEKNAQEKNTKLGWQREKKNHSKIEAAYQQ